MCDLFSKPWRTGEKKKGIFGSLKKKKKGRSRNFLSRSLSHISELRSSHRRSVNLDLNAVDKDNVEGECVEPSIKLTNSNRKLSQISLGQAPESPTAKPENLPLDGEGSAMDFSPGSTVSSYRLLC